MHLRMLQNRLYGRDAQFGMHWINLPENKVQFVARDRLCDREDRDRGLFVVVEIRVVPRAYRDLSAHACAGAQNITDVQLYGQESTTEKAWNLRRVLEVLKNL